MRSQQQPKTEQKTLPPRGSAPGLKIGRAPLRYWIARQVRREIMGFPDKCIPLPADADDTEIARLCQAYSAQLLAWIDEQERAQREDLAGGEVPKQPMSTYDGSVKSACEIYQRHPRSPFQKVKANSRRNYTDSLKIIEAEVGARLIRNLTIFDCQHWHEEWRKPAKPNRPERLRRAHGAISMFKTVIRFVGAALRRPECKQLADELEKIQFERSGAREEEMTFAQASAFIRKALELDAAGVLPERRGLYLAIGVAAQFELAVRQKDIIGERPKTLRDRQKAIARGAAAIDYGGVMWTGYFTWEFIPGWRWRMKTSKSKYRAASNFDLTIYPLLIPLLEAVPHEERVGAIVKGEHGFAVQERSYRKWFRPIARAAGIPDAVWNMDSRAGAATEAQEAGAELAAIRTLLTHSEKQEATTTRYLRRQDSQRVQVQQLRNRSREEHGRK